jgi:hypothetical protein
MCNIEVCGGQSDGTEINAAGLCAFAICQLIGYASIKYLMSPRMNLHVTYVMID